MSDKYMDLVIVTNGSVYRAPGFSNAQPGYKAMVQGVIHDVLEVVNVPVSEALMTLTRVDSVFHSLEYDEDKHEENADV